MNTYKCFKYLCTLILLPMMASCNVDDFLDRAPDSNLDENKVFTIFANAERFHADMYANLKSRFNVCGTYQPSPLSSASDESDSQYGYQATNRINVGVYDGEDPSIGNNYEGIRKVNTFLSKADVVPFPTDAVKNKMLGEAYFLRAFFFNEVVKRFGGMPIMDENSLLYPGDNLNRARDEYKTCVDFIIADLDRAISMLPITLSETEYGRASKGAAMALKSRVLLYASSPLWKSKMDKSYWAEAAQTALDVINLTDGGEKAYVLYNNGKGADDYEQLFFNRREHGNKEVIFAKQSEPVGFTTDEISVWAPKGGNLGGVGSVCPTQNFVDLFEMSNGKSIKDASSGYNPDAPFQNRDPRFYKTVLHHGAKWQGETMDLTYHEIKDKSGEHRKDKGYTRTGYYVRKYLPEQVKYQTTNRAYHNWIYIRLAEMYLNYAEAINEAADSQDNRLKAIEAVNQVRARSGMPGLPTTLSQSQLRERIWNERAVELSFEEHGWWDARRWQKAVEWFGGAMYEMEITKNDKGVLSYEIKPFFNRIYQSYMNLYPIPLSEMRKNPLYVQNPGW